jgi:hypothetical protein
MVIANILDKTGTKVLGEGHGKRARRSDRGDSVHGEWLGGRSRVESSIDLPSFKARTSC